jgi:hypothetical protein
MQELNNKSLNENTLYDMSIGTLKDAGFKSDRSQPVFYTKDDLTTIETEEKRIILTNPSLPSSILNKKVKLNDYDFTNKQNYKKLG